MLFNVLSLFVAAAIASPVTLDERTTCSSAGLISIPRRAQVIRAFTDSGVIPDSVPSINPTVDLKVAYGAKQMNLGNSFTTLETLTEPTFSFTPESAFDPSTTKYTFIIVDPDAPGPQLPLLRQFLHQITYDVQPSCITSQAPKTQSRYMALTPLSVAAHRYVYLVYRQPQGAYTPTPLNLIEEVVRAPFDLQKYVAENRLTLVGGNFMRQGLATNLCLLVPGCTQDGRGFSGPLNGLAEPANGIGELLGP